MDKSTSVIAALDAGKLPSTQQLSAFIDWLNDVGIAKVEPTANSELSSQGRVLANDLRAVLDAQKALATHKNGDNILQQAIWHLTEGDLTVTDEAEADKDQALKDINEMRRALRTLISTMWSSFSTEGTALFHDLMSIVRISLADAAELVEDKAGLAKESLRNVESEVQEGKRDTLGRDKKRLEQEEDPKVAWQHGMDTVKDAGTTVIGATQSTTAAAQEQSAKTSNRLQDAYYKIIDRAQTDQEYRQALDTLFTIIQKRLDSTIDAASDPNTTLSTFIADPTPEQHIPKALGLIRTLVERLAGTSLEPLVQKSRTCANSIVRDEDLKKWFDEFLATTRKNLAEPGYARSDESQAKRKELRIRWRTLLEKDQKWKASVDSIKEELKKVEEGLKNDEDLNALKEAHLKLGEDIERGLVEAGKEAQTGMQAVIEQATWFWQDLFKVYLPKMLEKMRDVPIPRTEFKDPEAEFVLENLDISSFNILPSHVYIRNITDVDIKTSANPSLPSKTNIGTLTHIKMQAVQLTLKDVSFWYKDKTASSLSASEFTGLMGLTLPEKGLDIDLKVRLIPISATGADSRDARKHYHIIERAEVTLSDDVSVEVRDSNHSVLVTLFKPIMTSRIREALQKTLSAQLHTFIDYVDGVAFDVGRRRQVFEDTGLSGGPSLMAALWSELGKFQRESRDGPTEVGWKATGTGVVVESRTEVAGTGDEFGQGKEIRKTQFAMGAEPQILSGEKRGPLGTGSEPIKDQLARLGEETGVAPAVRQVAEQTRSDSRMDVDVPETAEQAKQVLGEVKDKAQGLIQEGQRQVQGFRNTVQRKAEAEKRRDGWESSAFDV